ncbi:MAG: OmpA family protein [Kangiellaceae bacterium]|jgi:OOP family OmpA-OmpF porin|nr:OmpA family protein [Kangiellaceae bacterium]
MKKITALGIVSGFALASSVAQADVDRDFYFTLGAGGADFHSTSPDNSSNVQFNNLDESELYTAGLGFMFSPTFALQLTFNKFNPDDALGFGDEDLTSQSVDLMFFSDYDSDGASYVRLGLGQYSFESDIAGGGWQESDVAILGLGFEEALSDSVNIRAEFAVVNDTTYSRYDTQATLGFTFNFGGGDDDVAPVVKPVVPQTTKVVSNTNKDTDGDGVFDSKDMCPNTAANIVVDANGCELDSDGDGVKNSVDACPATPAGAKVDDKGCRLVLTETVTMTLNVKFQNNSSKLLPEFSDDIARLAKFMTEYPDTEVVVEGHSDSRGDDSYNMWLSEKRAKVVADVLVLNYNISRTRVSAKGMGETKPIADNNTAEGRATNRRVEAVIEATVSK